MTAWPRDPEAILKDDAFVRGLARGLLFDAHRAEDVAQEAWLATLRTNVPPRESQRSWLSGVVKNLAFKSWRGESRRAARERQVAKPPAAPSGAPSAEEILEREALRREVVTAVLALEEPYQAAILLRFFDNLAPREIAARLGEPVETVRTRIKRGLAMLRESLDRKFGDRESWAFLLLPCAGPGAVKAALGGATWKGALAMTAKSKGIAAAAVILLIVASTILVVFMGRPSVRDDDPAPHVTLSDARTAGAALTPTASGAPRDSLAPAPPRASSDPDSGEAAETPPTGGGLDVLVVWDADGAPIPRAPLAMTPRIPPNPYARRVDVKTDEQGRFQLRDLSPGNYDFECGFGGDLRVRVEGAKTAAGTLRVPRGTTLRGIVVDGRDLGVPSAAIWVGRQLSGFDGQILATTAADGTFEIKSLATETWTRVGARASGFAPSSPLILHEAPGAVRNVKLRLDAEGGLVTGAVVDSYGKAVPRAVVLIGMPDQSQVSTPEGDHATTPPGIRITAGDDGRFRCDFVPLGKHRVIARAPGLGPYRGETEVVATRAAELAITLQAGATVSGVVRDERGAPVALASISIGNDGYLDGALGRTGDDGAFRIAEVNTGVIAISSSHDRLGHACTTLEAKPGESVRWEAVLKRGPVLRIRVLDEHGTPLDGATIQARSEEPGDWKLGKTGADGRAEIIGCRAAPYAITVSPPEGGSHSVAEKSGIRPDEEETVVTIPDAARPSCIIAGSVILPDGRPAGGAGVDESRDGDHAWMVHRADAEGGRFQLGPLPPGTYRLRISMPGYPGIDLGPKVLGKNERWDTGTIQLEAPKQVETPK